MGLLGKRSTLIILRDSDHGQVLDGGNQLGEVLLPLRYVDPELEPGDEVEVFLYNDSEDRPVATTEIPLAEVGDFAALEVKELTRVGAFLDWGLSEDALLPHSNQKGDLEVGQRIVVQVLFDTKSKRIFATQKLGPARGVGTPAFQPGQKVEALIASEGDLGWTCVVEGLHLGLLYHNEIFRPLREGDKIDAYVREVREDDRIDLSLEPLGYGRIPPLRNRILTALREDGGRLGLHDKSPPEEIQAAFDCSKKNFKKALGALYREGLIELGDDGVRLRK